jgi:dolichol-phosphate mannosyltransferase
VSRDTDSFAVQRSAEPTAVLLRGLRRPSNWAQLVRFAVVGTSGYAVNLAVFSLALDARLDYRAAAATAFVVALVSNFFWNRVWTFPDASGRLHGQAFRFVVVSGAGFLVSVATLTTLVTYADAPKLLAQAASLLAVMPLSFLANKLWSFRTSQR